MSAARWWWICLWSFTCSLVLPNMVRAGAFVPDSSGYAYGFWPKNPRGVREAQDYRFAVQTNQYGLLLNVYRAAIEQLGCSPEGISAERALSGDDSWLGGLPVGGPVFLLAVDGRRYRLASAGVNPLEERNIIWHGLRLISGGRVLQHFEIINLQFADEQGLPLTGLMASLEFVCWPDFFAVTLHLQSSRGGHTSTAQPSLVCGIELPQPIRSPESRVRLEGQTNWRTGSDFNQQFLNGIAWVDRLGGGLALLTSPDGCWQLKQEHSGRAQLERSFAGWPSFTPLAMSLLVVPRRSGLLEYCKQLEAPQQCAPPVVALTAQTTTGQSLPSRFDRRLWADVVSLPAEDDLWKTEKITLRLTNNDATTHALRLLLEKIYDIRPNQPRNANLHGFGSFLADPDSGDPLGFPMAISKNWHVQPSWSRVSAQLLLAPKAQGRLEYQRPNAMWGGVPAISHAQLCLIGWGGNQLWDQVALGAFGENITYDPYVNLERSVVDDIRPLMVWGLGEKHQKWVWTENVGGADFLTLETQESRQAAGVFDAQMERIAAGLERPGNKIYPTYLLLPDAQKTLYRRIGPVLSEVAYGGSYAGGRIHSIVTAHSWRSDDYFRTMFHLRYDVVKTIDFERCAFFQLGADQYNDNLYKAMARGNAHRLLETWVPPMGEAGGYSRRSVDCPGPLPWFAMLGAQPEGQRSPNAAWPNRLLTIQAWQARLAGKAGWGPYYSIRGTSNGYPSALLELSPPPQVQQLQPGDYVDAWIELDLLPQAATDYYGPNPGFQQALNHYPNGGELAHWAAQGADYQIQMVHGRLLRSRLPQIQVEQNEAEFVIQGGHGYLPFTLRGLTQTGPFRLECKREGGWEALDTTRDKRIIRQTDFDPESGTYDVSYTLDLRVPTTHLRFWLEATPAGR